MILSDLMFLCTLNRVFTKKRKFCFLLLISSPFLQAGAQVCVTPGKDGVGREIESGPFVSHYYLNTYFAPLGEVELLPGSKQVMLDAIKTDLTIEKTSIEPGDLLLIIQMQDGEILASNDVFYGGNNANSGPDGKGATGYTDLGNTGKYEYVIATNAVPLTGGVLNFIGSGIGKGTVNTYVSALSRPNSGARVFQVIRIPQYSNIQLSINSGISLPFNGKVGGVLAIHVNQTLDFGTGGFNVTHDGFRGGYSDKNFSSGTSYVAASNDRFSLGKGEGIVGSPRSTIKTGEVVTDQGYEGLPMGDHGRGAPGNAGGGGAGGGGGGNGGAGGRGGNGLKQQALTTSIVESEGRPGERIYSTASLDLSRLIMGGGGGAGDGHYTTDERESWRTSGGEGGGIILVQAGNLKGNGVLYAAGGDSHSHGAGAGGTIFVNLIHPLSPLSFTRLSIWATGGRVLATTSASDSGISGLGGGGGGGQVFHNLPLGIATINVKGGAAGLPRPNETLQLGEAGQDGNVVSFTTADLPPYLRMGTCYPELTTIMRERHSGMVKHPGDEVIYTIKTTNAAATANAAGTRLEVQLPPGFTFSRAAATYTGYSAGPSVLSNLGGNPNRPVFGDFIFFSGDEITLTLIAKVGCNTVPGTYHSSVQALYLDPTRTVLDSNRRVSPSINALQGTKTTYESGTLRNVAGSNYDGNLAISIAEDVVISAISVENNVIQTSEHAVFCMSGNPAKLIGELPRGLGDNFSYQWQRSADNVNFIDIPGALSRDFDPEPIIVSTYYRRQVLYSGCVSIANSSNALFFKVLKPLPVVDFELPDICLRDGTATFKNKTTIEDGFESDLTYHWDFGDAASATPGNPNQSSAKDGIHNYTHTGRYIIGLTAYKEGNCPTILQKEFIVNGSIPKADFSILNTSFCSGEQVVFEDRASVDFGEITRIEWYFDSGNDPGSVEVDEHPQKRAITPLRLYRHVYPLFRSPAVKSINVRMVAYSGISCINEVIKTINLNAVPEVRFDVIPAICQDASSVQLTQGKEIWGVVSGSGKYSGSGVTAKGIFNPATAGVGTHPINYTYISNNGCLSASKTQTITVLPRPLVNAGEDQMILEGGQVQLGTTTNEANLTYQWNPSTGLNMDNIPNPIASPVRDIIYKLKITTNGGCSATDEVSVKVLRNPEIPNTFTPNGDNINDEWNIRYLNSYPDATIYVFNRYGEKVFSSTSSGLKSWDGKHGGKDVPVGVYYYIIDPHNGRKTISGSLTVLR